MNGENGIFKLLSPNDVGETGSHQAGILIPKRLLSFFPTIQEGGLNPRVAIDCCDDGGQAWEFHFIYYNNRHFGGTRNEYRLTGMTKFLKHHKLAAGDLITLFWRDDGRLHISHEYQKQVAEHSTTLVLGSSWREVPIKRGKRM